MDFSLRQLCQSQKQYPLLSHVAGISYSAPVTNAWPERVVSAVKWIKTRYFYCGSIFFCMMQWTYFLFVLLWQVCPSYSRLRSLLKDDMLNVLLQVSINGPTLAEANSIIQQAAKVKIIPCLTFPLAHTFYNVHVVVFPSVIQISFLSL